MGSQDSLPVLSAEPRSARQAARRAPILPIAALLISMTPVAAQPGPKPGPGDAAKAPPMTLDVVEALVSAFDSPGSASDLDSSRVMDELPRAVRFIDEHLAAHPEDARAIILAARVALMGIAFEEAGGRPRADPAQDWLEGIVRKLEGLLAGNPDNAEAHFWAAQCYGLGSRDAEAGIPVVMPADAAQAAAHARRAHEIAPGDTRYAEYLLDVLIQTDDLAGAAALARAVEGAHSDALRLIDDLRELSLPQGAVYLLRESRVFGVLQMMRGALPNLPDLRARIYRVSGTVAQVESHFMARHPGFRFITETSDDGAIHGRTQWLRPAGGDWHPAPPESVLDEDRMKEGISLAAIPSQDIPPERRSDFGPRESEPFVVLILTNHRPAADAPQSGTRRP